MSRLVVVGDTLLDRDVDGTVDRFCPGTPAPVLTEKTTVDRPGGAGLAALLAAVRAPGVAEVILVTALAGDAGGARLTRLLAGAGVRVHPLALAGATPEKVRVRAGGRVLLRLDRGGGDPVRATPPVPAVPAPEALRAIRDAAAVLVSDYGRGVARRPEIRSALAGTAAPVVWDPHPHGVPAVPGCRLVTPNEAELAGLAGARRSSPPERARRFAVLAQHAQQLRRRWRAGAVAVTLGADGALLSHADATPLVVPVPARTDGDSCGAGDQFAGAAALALARGALVSEAVEAAVAAATGYVAAGAADALRGDRRPAATAGGGADGEAGGGTDSEAGGGRTPGPGARLGTRATGELVAAVRARGGTVVATGGCFDLLHAGHVATLQAARGLGDCLVVCVNSDRSVAHLKGPARPLVSQHDRVHLLAALGCVDAVVVFDEATPEAVLSWLRPDIWAKGGDYAGGTPDPADLPEAGAVRRWGGQAVVVPYLAGRSTTGMIAAARDDGRHAPAAGDRRSRAPRLPDGHPAKGA